MKRIITFSAILIVVFHLFGQKNVDSSGNPIQNGTALPIPPPVTKKGSSYRSISSGTIINAFPSPTTGVGDLAFDGKDLWVQGYNEFVLFKISPLDGTVLKTIPTISLRPYGLTFDGQHLWLTDNSNLVIQKIDTSNGNVLVSFPTPADQSQSYPFGLAWDGSNLWHSDIKNPVGTGSLDSLFHLETNGNIINAYDHFLDQPSGLAFDGTYLWSSDNATDKIYKIDTASFLAIDTIDAPGGEFPNGLAFDGQYLWVSNNDSDSIYQIDIDFKPCINTFFTFSVSSCSTYTVPSGNTTYSSIGTYTIMDTIPNSCGTDSVMSIDLTINQLTGTDVQTACDSYTWIDDSTYTTSDSSATYIMTNSLGCDSVVTLHLAITAIDSSVTQAGSILTATESEASYQWLNCEGNTPIDGAIDQSYSVTSSGNYAVIITQNECSDTSACYSVVATGIIENDLSNEILLYPNPTDGNFTIDLGEISRSARITITDLRGKIMHTTAYHNSQMLNLEFENPDGVYLLFIESEEKKGVIRLIKR